MGGPGGMGPPGGASLFRAYRFAANYPGLAHEDVLACLAYASHLAHEYRAYPLPV